MCPIRDQDASSTESRLVQEPPEPDAAWQALLFRTITTARFPTAFIATPSTMSFGTMRLMPTLLPESDLPGSRYRTAAGSCGEAQVSSTKCSAGITRGRTARRFTALLV